MQHRSPIPEDEASTALIAVGSNASVVGISPVDRLENAISRLAALPDTHVRANSRFFLTPCFPAGAGPDYVNATVVLTTRLSAGALLDALHGIEDAEGRKRNGRWGARTLDLDLLTHGDAVLPDLATFAHWRDLPVERQQAVAPDRLILPHPRIQDRAFVLIPLLDVAPDWCHPVSGLSVRQMAAARPDVEKNAVRAL